jgi:hypothetical protein
MVYFVNEMIKKITLLLLITFFSLLAQPLKFYRERIELKVSDNYFEVTGTYYFKNQSLTKFTHALYYPFLIDEKTMYPFEINVFDQRMKKSNSFIKTKDGISFPIIVNAGDTSIYTVKYKQTISGNKAEYILTTTAQWGKPFTIAEYTITIPTKFNAAELSYPFDTVEINAGNKIYKITKKNFMPNKNLVVKWE